MANYIENPKTTGSGIVCVIPQTGICPNRCADCFFQSGRSYLEPLEKNLPNMIDPREVGNQVVRVNDGNDSNIDRERVIEATNEYPRRFFNTSLPRFDFPGPVVLTINPGEMTDHEFYLINKVPSNLMFVRVRANAWNESPVIIPAVKWYSEREVPVVLTFMAYHEKKSIPHQYRCCYIYRKRTLNSYYAISTMAWRTIMDHYWSDKWVYSCGKIEGELGITACRHCGNCLREYFVTMEQMDHGN